MAGLHSVVHPLKRISLFFGLCLLIYAVLVVPWPGLMDGYRAFFRAGGNVLFRRFGEAGLVTFQPLSSVDHTKDTTVILLKRSPPSAKGEMDITAVYTGYRPTAFFIALALATPIPWSRRWKALVLGLLLVNAFVALRVWLRILDAFSDNNPLALYAFSPFWKDTLEFVAKVLVLAPAMHYAAPAFIWLMVAFRRDDLTRLFSQPQSALAATSRAGHKRRRRRPA